MSGLIWFIIGAIASPVAIVIITYFVVLNNAVKAKKLLSWIAKRFGV